MNIYLFASMFSFSIFSISYSASQINEINTEILSEISFRKSGEVYDAQYEILINAIDISNDVIQLYNKIHQMNIIGDIKIQNEEGEEVGATIEQLEAEAKFAFQTGKLILRKVVSSSEQYEGKEVTDFDINNFEPIKNETSETNLFAFSPKKEEASVGASALLLSRAGTIGVGLFLIYKISEHTVNELDSVVFRLEDLQIAQDFIYNVERFLLVQLATSSLPLLATTHVLFQGANERECWRLANKCKNRANNARDTQRCDDLLRKCLRGL